MQLNDGAIVVLANLASEYGVLATVLVACVLYLKPVLDARNAANRASAEVYESQLKGLDDRVKYLQDREKALMQQLDAVITTNGELLAKVSRLERLVKEMQVSLEAKNETINTLRRNTKY